MSRLDAQAKAGMFYSDKCSFCGGYGDKVEPWVCDGCKVKIERYIKEHAVPLPPTFDAERKAVDALMDELGKYWHRREVDKAIQAVLDARRGK